MTSWVEFVKKVQHRDGTTYSNALKTASSEWKKHKSTEHKSTEHKSNNSQETKLRKLDGTAKRRNDIQVRKTQKNIRSY